MLAWICSLTVALAIPGTHPKNCPVGFGWVWPAGVNSGTFPTRYDPQPGDVLLFSTRELGFFITFAIARSSHPYHSGIVIRLRDGRLAMLESGGGGVKAVNIRLLEERLPAHFTDYPDRQPITWVRRIRQPLTPSESELLTVFAEKHYGNRFPPARD